jgi:hypothetical protein
MLSNLSPDCGDNSTAFSAREVRITLGESGFKKRLHRSFEIDREQKFGGNVRSDDTERPIVIKANEEKG